MDQQQQRQQQQRQKYYNKQKKIQKYPSVRKPGLFKPSQAKIILHIIHQSVLHFPTDINKQCDLIIKMVEEELGKIFQLFIYERSYEEGHGLYAVKGRYMTVEYKDYMYVLWQVELEEDPNK